MDSLRIYKQAGYFSYRTRVPRNAAFARAYNSTNANFTRGILLLLVHT